MSISSLVSTLGAAVDALRHGMGMWRRPLAGAALAALVALVHATGWTEPVDLAAASLLAAADGLPPRSASPLVIVGPVDEAARAAVAARHGWADVVLVDDMAAFGEAGRLAESPACAWVDCAGFHHLLVEAVDVPVLTLDAVMSASPGQIYAAGPVLLTGREAPAVAVARAVASARVGGLLRAPRLAEVGLWLLTSFLVGSICVTVAQGARGAFALLWPLAIFTLGFDAGELMPLTALLLATFLGMAAAQADRGQGAEALRRLTLVTLRAAGQGGALRRRLVEVEGLQLLLSDMVAAHVPAVDHGLLLLRGRELMWFPGTGIDRQELPPGPLRPSQPAIAAALAHRRPVPANGLVGRGEAVLVPLEEAGEAVALWLLRSDPPGALPPAELLVGLASDVSGRLALSPPTAPPSPELLGELLAAADAERRRWALAILGLGVPVLVADVAGRVQMINPAMQRALEATGLARPRTVAELVARVGPEGGLATGRGLVGRLTVNPICDGEDPMPIGFAAWIEGERKLVPQQLQQPGAVQRGGEVREQPRALV